jgi:hypothetical protein
MTITPRLRERAEMGRAGLEEFLEMKAITS